MKEPEKTNKKTGVIETEKTSDIASKFWNPENPKRFTQARSTGEEMKSIERKM